MLERNKSTLRGMLGDFEYTTLLLVLSILAAPSEKPAVYITAGHLHRCEGPVCPSTLPLVTSFLSTMTRNAIQYALSAREYELLHDFLVKRTPKAIQKRAPSVPKPSTDHDYNPAAFRSALRVFLVTSSDRKSVV